MNNAKYLLSVRRIPIVMVMRPMGRVGWSELVYNHQQLGIQNQYILYENVQRAAKTKKMSGNCIFRP